MRYFTFKEIDLRAQDMHAGTINSSLGTESDTLTLYQLPRAGTRVEWYTSLDHVSFLGKVLPILDEALVDSSTLFLEEGNIRRKMDRDELLGYIGDSAVTPRLLYTKEDVVSGVTIGWKAESFPLYGTHQAAVGCLPEHAMATPLLKQLIESTAYSKFVADKSTEAAELGVDFINQWNGVAARAGVV